MHRRRRVCIEAPKGPISAGFTVPETADAADVAMKLRKGGWEPYRIRLEREQKRLDCHCDLLETRGLNLFC